MRSARSRSQSTGRYGAAVVIALVALLAIVSAAPGYWSGGDEVDGTGAAVAATVLQGAAPTASEAGSGNVVVDWGNSGLSNGVPADGYIVRRYATVTGFSAAVGAGCAGTRTTTVCTETGTPPGDWQYTVTPVFADNWRGAESVASGDVDTGPGTMTLARLAFGGTVAPLPVSVAGTVAGFAPNGAISYTLDDIAPLTGSPTHVGASGTAAITLTIPAGIGDGPHTISVVGASAEASVGIVVDTTAPSITLFTTPAPNAAGWNNTSPVEVNGTVDDGSGSGLAFGKYTTDGSDPKTSPTSQFAVAPLSITETSTLKFYLADVAGNESAVETLPVKIDTTPPYFTVAFVDVTGGVYLGPTNVGYYRGADAGSLRFEMTPIPMGGSTVISAGFSAMPPDAFGFSFDSSAVTTPAGGPFVGNPVSWEAGTASNPSGTVTLTDEAGNTFGGSGPLLNDSTAPAGGHADATGLVGTGGRYSTSLTIGLDLAKGADAQSGLADGSGQSDVPARLMRASAALTSDGVANGSCGIYGAFAQVGGNDPLSSVEDTVPDDRTCYRYRYLVSDHVGNVATYVTPDIKVQTGPSALLRPTDATLTAVSGIAAQVVSGSTVFYNPAQSGSFDVNTTSSAPYAGVSALGFPAIAGFSGGGTVTAPISGTTYRGTYAWSANEASPSPGVQSISATNNIGQTATTSTAFSVVRDDSGPSGGSVDATGLGGTGGRYSTSMTLSVLLARGSDAGAGLATSGAQLLRASAALTSDGTASGGCGTFGPYNEVGADDPASPRSDTVPVDRICYRYHYVVSDGVGNDTTYSSGDVKVDATAPPVPGLGFSALDNAYWSGTGSAIFYRPGAASGAFKVTATSVDTAAGTSAIDFPVLPAGWTSSSGGLGIRTYAWSAPNPTAPVGAQTVTASNHAGRSSSSTFTATADVDPPAGGGVSYATGYTGASTIAVAFSAGADAGSGLDLASALLQRSRAALANGTCGTFDAFATVASAPTTPNTDSISAGNCYQYRYRVADNVGNLATYTSAGVVKVDGGAPVVSIADPGAAVRGTVTLTVNADDGAGAGVTTVTLQRAPTATTTWTDVCTDTVAPYSCSLDTTALTTGTYDLRASATDGAGNSAFSDTVSMTVDNVLPTITMTDPGSPINGTITLATTADDADSGVAGVTIQRAPAGTGTWTNACVISASPWTCRFDTTALTDGSYDFRATAVDVAGNTKTSTVIGARSVNNLTANSVSLEDPGAYLSGTVTLRANANSPQGVASVRIQRSGAGLNSWTDICTDTISPYTCAFDTATAATPRGLYDLRAIMTPVSGGTLTSATVAGRTIDNSPVRGVDVQATNSATGTLGRMDQGDILVLTYSVAMKASTLIGGWTGTGPASLSVRLVDVANVESIALNSSGTIASGLGVVTPSGNYATKNKTVTYASTATLSTAAGGGSVVTIVLGAPVGVGRQTQSTAVTMRWTPSATATDLAGVASSVSPATETGTVDRDF